MKNIHFYILLALIVLLFAIIFIPKGQKIGPVPLGGVTVGNEYTATSTPQDGVWTDQLLASGWGALGSVNITTAGDLRFRLYDATSTNAIANGNLVLDNQQLAEFPASAAVGTYTFDVGYTDGLVLDVVSGTLGTSTISFR